MKKRKLRKPKWILLSSGSAIALCSNENGVRKVWISGYPIKASKVEQLAKWFTAASAWLKQEGEK